jgi:type I site-specific restriction endonuclease
LIRGITELGCKKTIVYLRCQEEAMLMKKCIENINQYFALDIYVDTIISKDNREQRNSKLKKFESYNGYAIMCSVEILNECIDIPKCDSIYITYPSKSKIRNIQRLCRANRKDKENPNKITRVFLWADEFDDTVEIIRHLKEFDNSFTVSKVNLFNGRNNNNPKISRSDKKYELAYSSLDNYIIGIQRVVDSFDENYKKLIDFQKQFNKLPDVHLEDNLDRSLAHWCSRIRQKYNKGKLLDERIKLLEKVPGWKWEYRKTIEDRCQDYAIWLEENDNDIPKRNGPGEGEHELNVFAMSMRIKYKKKKLTDKQIIMLKKLKIL